MSSTQHPPIPQSAYDEGLFIQELSPIGGSLVGSFFVGIIPLLVVLVLLGGFRMPAHYASFIGLVVCIFIAIFAWHMPAQQCFESIGNGITFANWPIMWIVVNAMFIYNVAVRSGIFDLFRRWMITNTPPDQRVMLLVIGFSFGSLLEGVAGFGTPGAICSALMVSLGFDKVKALTFTLIFDTTPVAFGALGIPITTLAKLTGLPVQSLSAMVGRQLPFISLFLPLYAMIFFAGFRAGLMECWPIALVGGFTFALFQAVFSNWVGPELPDLIAGLMSLLALIIFVQFWKPPYREEYVLKYHSTTQDNDEEKNARAAVAPDHGSANGSSAEAGGSRDEKVEVSHHEETTQQQDERESTKDSPNVNAAAADPTAIAPVNELVKPTWLETAYAWSPWLLIVVVVIIWSFAKVSSYGAIDVQWPHLHNRIWLTLYGQKYAAVWSFQPLATGTAILCSGIVFCGIALLYGAHPRIFPLALKDTVLQLYLPILTVSFILALAYLYNYSGIVYTIGLTLSSVGKAFPFLSAWLGWLACCLSGSDTSANSLFGNLQVVAAREIGLSAVLMAATNSSAAVTAKMVSPQNLTTGVATIQMQGKEGYIFRKTIAHSIIMCCAIGVMAMIQQFGTEKIIPPGDEVLLTS